MLAPRRTSIVLALTLVAGALAGGLPDGLSLGPKGGPCFPLNQMLPEGARIPPRVNGISPLETYRRAPFEDACRALQACISTPGAERELCEAQLRSDLLTICGRTYGRYHEEAARQRCEVTARLVAEGVAKHGARLFRDAQYEALHMESDEVWPGRRSSLKWGIAYPARTRDPPTRWQRRPEEP